MFVVTADQKRSRTAIDRVPALLQDLNERLDVTGQRDQVDRPGGRSNARQETRCRGC